MEDGRCLLDVINDLESVLSELDPPTNWNTENNQNGDPSALDEFFQSTANNQVAAAANDEELWSTTDGLDGQDGGGGVYQDPLAEAMASITGPSPPTSPQLLSDLSGTEVLEQQQLDQSQYTQYSTSQLVSSAPQLVSTSHLVSSASQLVSSAPQLLSSAPQLVSSATSIPTQVLQYSTQQQLHQATPSPISVVGSSSPARVLTPQPTQSPLNPTSRTESPLVRQIVTPQGQQIQLNQNQLNFILSQQQGGQNQQTMTFVTQHQAGVSTSQGIQTQANVLPVINRGIGNVQLRQQGVVPGTTLQGAIIQTSNGQRILIQQPVLPGQQINLAQLQQQLQAQGGGTIQLQGAQPIQVQGAGQPIQIQGSTSQPIHLQNTQSAPAQGHMLPQQTATTTQPLLQHGTSTPLPQQTFQLPLQQAIQQLQGSNTAAGKAQPNVSIINVNTPNGPQQILIRNGPQNQNIILGALPSNVIQIQTSGANQPAQVMVAQPGLQSGVSQPHILNSQGTSIGQPHVLGNVNLVNSAQNVNINMVLPAGQNLQTLQAAQQALQLQGQQLVNIVNSQGQTVQVPKNLLNQNIKLNIGGQQVPINLQQLKQLQGLGLQQPIVASVATSVGNRNTISVSQSMNTASNVQTVFASQNQLQQQQSGTPQHPIVIGSSTPPSSSQANIVSSTQVSSSISVPIADSQPSTANPQAAGQLVYNITPTSTPSSYPYTPTIKTEPGLISQASSIPMVVPNTVNSVTYSQSMTQISHPVINQTVLQAPPNINIQNIGLNQKPNTNIISNPVQVLPKVVSTLANIGSSVPQVINAVSQMNTGPVMTTLSQVINTPTMVTAQHVAPKQPVIMQSNPVIQLSPQNQEMMKQLQSNIAKLQNLPNRTEKHENLLRQLKEVLQKLLLRARADALRSQQQQVISGYTVNNDQGQNLAPQQGMTVITAQAAQSGGIMQVQQIQNGQPAAVKVIRPVVAGQQVGAGTPGTPNKPVKPPVSATVTLATATTNIPLLAPGQQIKLQIPQALQEKLAKLTPEQQQIFLKTHGPLLVKLHQEQQQRLLQQQQQQQQQQQGNVPLTVQPIQLGTQLRPLLTTAAGTITIRPAQPLTKSAIINQQLQRDQREATHPDFKTPFKNVKDVCKRLIRYHVFQSSEPTAQEFEDDESLFEEVSQGLLDKKNRMFEKYRSLIYAESMRAQPMSEMAMLEKMFIQSERELLESERKLAKEKPELFKPCPCLVTDEQMETPVIKEVKPEPTLTSSEERQKRKIPVVISDSEEEEENPPVKTRKLSGGKEDKYTAKTRGGLRMVFKTSPKPIKQEPNLTAAFDLKPFSIKLEPLPDFKATNLLGSQVKLEKGDLEKVLRSTSKDQEVMFTDDEDDNDKGGSQSSLFAFSDAGAEDSSSRISAAEDEESSEADTAVTGLLGKDKWGSPPPLSSYSKSQSMPYKRSKQDPLGLETSQDSELDSTVNSFMDGFDCDKASDFEDSQLGEPSMNSRRSSPQLADMFGTDDEDDGDHLEVDSAINSILCPQGSDLDLGDQDPSGGSGMGQYLGSQGSDSQDDLEAAINSILY